MLSGLAYDCLCVGCVVWCLVAGVWCLMSGVWWLVAGGWWLVSGIWWLCSKQANKDYARMRFGWVGY